MSGTVFFGAVGTDYSQPSVMHALILAGWVSVAMYLLSGLARLLLPRRGAVLAHAEAQQRLLEADVEVLPATHWWPARWARATHQPEPTDADRDCGDQPESGPVGVRHQLCDRAGMRTDRHCQ